MHGATQTIENKTLSVTVDDASGKFSVADKATGKIFLTNGSFEGGVIKVEAGRHEITLTQADGSTVSLELRKNQPFVFITKQQMNRGPAERDFKGPDYINLKTTVLATFQLDLGKPAAELKTLGTGGLCAPDKNPGSYLFLTCADPSTRRGVVAGWLTHERGSGVLFSSVKDNKVEFKAQIDYGHLRISAGKLAQLETLAIGCFDDARIGEELFADVIAKHYRIKLRPQVAGYCTWYDDKHRGAGDETSIVEMAEFVAKELKPFGLSVVQIDDEWQDGGTYNGPRRGFDRVKADGPYPHGMQSVAGKIGSLGLTPGIWFMPFARNHQDPEYQDRQHWFVKRDNGQPYETYWGGTSLDLTLPEVREHLTRLIKLIRSWGYTYFKMDGLWTGTATKLVYVNDGYRDDLIGNNAPFHDPTKSNIETFRDGLKLVRAAAGPEVFFSGCNVSQNMRILGGAIGLVDSMRIGPDNHFDWRNIISGPIRGSRLYFLHGRVWWNDPDPCYVREKVPLNHARFLSSWVAITGQFYLISDWLPELPAERLEIIKRTIPAHGVTARPVDYFDSSVPTTWLVTDTRQAVRRDVIGLFNFGEAELNVKESCERLGLVAGKRYHAFDFWANERLPDFTGTFQAQVPLQSCRIIAVRADEGHPVLLSTSRHVTQGIVDVTDEKWTGNKLSGVSEVVANDPYELRICVPAGWALVKATADVDVTVAESAGLARIRFLSPVGRRVKWNIVFKRSVG